MRTPNARLSSVAVLLLTFAMTGLGLARPAHARIPEDRDRSVASPMTDVALAEVQAVAAGRNITLAAAQELLRVQSDLEAEVEILRKYPNFVDFRFTPNGLVGELLVEPGSKSNFIGPAERMTTIEAKLNGGQRERIVRQALERGRFYIGDGVVGASYDAFEDKLLVVVDQDRLTIRFRACLRQTLNRSGLLSGHR